MLLRRSLSLPVVASHVKYPFISATLPVVASHVKYPFISAIHCQQYQWHNSNLSQETHFSTSTRSKGVQVHSVKILECYSVLNITKDANVTQVKEAFIKSAKLYHPDSGSECADADKFTQVKEAYKTLLEEKKYDEAVAAVEEDVEKVVFDIRHTAPQHRQYLSFEGIGSGTPSQRQRIYQQFRVAKASDNIHDYRTQHLANEEESAVVVKDKIQAKKAKISNAIERLVEDMIQDAMTKGDFDNLAGKGKPLSYENRNPLLDTDTHNLNKILINNGYAPEWITLQSEIRKDLNDSRCKLAVLRSKMGEIPFDPDDAKRWNSQVAKFRVMIDGINEKIEKFNMIVPFLDKQMVLYSTDRETHRIYTNWQRYLPDDQTNTDAIYDAHFGSHHVHYQMTEHKVNWTEVWTHIKQVFKS